MDLVGDKWPKATAGRAQDWILSALNPIIDGLRREVSFLGRSRWHWQPGARRLEYVRPVTDYVSEIFRDNFDDFVRKFPAVQRAFQTHDAAVDALERAVASAYDRLSGDDAREARTRVESLFSDADKLQYSKYFLASIASGIDEESSRSIIAEAYNGHPEIRSALEEIAQEELARARAAAEDLRRLDEDLLPALIELRAGVADEYGARIMPVG